MSGILYVGYRDELGNPTGPTPDQARAENQWNHPDTFFQLLAGGSGSGKTTRAVKACIETAMKYPGMNQFWGHLQLDMFEPGPFKALHDILPKTLVEINGDMLWTIEFKKTQDSRFILIRIPGFIHPTRGYTAKITYWGLDERHGWVRKLEKQGGSFGLGYFDQLDLLKNDSAFRAFITRFRTAPMKFIATTNPDKSGWWHRYWTDDPRFVTEQTRFYAKTVMNPEGNQHVHERYVGTMRSTLSKDQSQRMVDGIDIYEGEMVFGEFDNIENTTKVSYPIPSDWILHEFWDYGWNDPANVCLFGQTPENKTILIDILRINRTSPQDVAAMWLYRKDALLERGRLIGDTKPEIHFRVCDPRMFNRNNDGGPCIADQIASYQHPTGESIFLTPSSLKRVRLNENIKFSQILAAKQLFKDRTLLVNSDGCDEFFEEIESYVFDEKTQMPKEYRKMGKGGVVIHHHDTMDNIEKMAGTLYLPQPEDEEEKLELGNGYRKVKVVMPSQSNVIKALRAYTC